MERRLSRRNFLHWGALVLGAAAVSGCAKPTTTQAPTQVVAETAQAPEPTPAPKEPTKVTVWMPAIEHQQAYMEGAIERYLEKQSQVQPVLEVWPGDAWSQKLGTEISAGRGCDLWDMHGASLIRDLQSKGAVAAIPEDVMSVAYIKENWSPGALATATWRGEYTFLPEEFSGWSFISHRTLREEAGVSELPTSYEQTLEFMRKTTKVEDGVIVQAGTGMHGWTYTWFCMNYLSAGGEKIWDRQPDKQTAAFDNELGVASLKAITDLVTLHHFWEPGFPDAVEGFQDHKIATIFGSGWMTGTMLKDHPEWPIENYSIEYGVPTVGPNGPKMFCWPGWGWAVLSETKVPEAAWDFWRFVYTPEEMAQFIELSGEGCPGKPLCGEMVKRFQQTRPDLLLQFEETAKYGVFEPVWDMQTVETEFSNARDRIIIEGASVEQALNTAVTNIDAAIAKAFQQE